MGILINLFQSETTIHLHQGKYDLYFLGGFDVMNEQNFGIAVVEVTSGTQLPFEFTWRIRTYKKDQRAVKYFRFEVEKEGQYCVHIFNPEQLTIRKYLDRRINWFAKAVTNDEKNVFIEEATSN